MSSTAIGPVEDALLAMLLADPTLAGIEGPPQLAEPIEPMPRHVWIDATVAADDQRVLTSDAGERLEAFELVVQCFAVWLGNDFVTARNRASALADKVADVCSANFHLTFPVGTVDLHVAGVTRDRAAWEKTVGVVYMVRVRVEAILT